MAACEAGGKQAHRWTKPPSGVSLGDSALSWQGVADSTLAEWQLVWGETQASNWSAMEAGDSLPRPGIDNIRRASQSFNMATAVSGDFIHPKSICLLDVIALEALEEVFMLIEEVGTAPIDLLTLVFIDKPGGAGKRPIGLLTGLMRLWGKVRRPYGKAWEADNARPYFWAGKGRPAADSAHQQTLKAEIARAKGISSASSLLDMVKCYERLSTKLWLRRREGSASR